MPVTNQSTNPNFQPNVEESINLGVGQETAGQTGLPDLSQLATSAPELGVPGMDPSQSAQLQYLLNNANANPWMDSAGNQLAELTSGPVGSSPATKAGMEAYYSLTAPQIAQDSALRGTGSGGQANEAQALGAEQAALPLIQQEVSNREAAVGQESNLANQQVQQLAMALEASGLPREVALQQAQAQYQQQQQDWQSQMGLQEQPLSWVPATIGQTSVGRTTNTWEDWAGGIGNDLSPSGLFGK